MTNLVLDMERAAFLEARTVIGKVEVPAWPRPAKDLSIVELEVDWVRLSTLNHRTRAEQRAVESRTTDPWLFTQDPLGQRAQNAQYKILCSQEGFADLKQDLSDRGQQEPAIVTADGVLINGNRRTAALRSLYLEDNRPNARYVRCLVLPDDATAEELIDLETELQIARDFKQDYGWVNEAFLIEELFERENKDFTRVARKMHRTKADVQSLYDKLQQVHQVVDLSGGARQHIDFNDNEAAFDELAKHIKNKPPTEAEAVRSVYFLGTLSGVPYRKLRLLRRPDAAILVHRELENDPSLRTLVAAASSDSGTDPEADILDDVLGSTPVAGPVTPLLNLLATKKPDETLVLDGGEPIDVQDVLSSIQSAIMAAADEAKENLRDQEAQLAPLTRVNSAITEFERALISLPRARAFGEFDETAVAARVRHLAGLIENYMSDEP